MKTKIVLLFLMISSFCFAQGEDEITDFDKVTKTLTGYLQEVTCNYPEKVVIIDNRAGSSTVYYCLKRSGVIDSVTKVIPILAGTKETFYNFTPGSFWIKGTSGSVDIYLLKGRGRGIIQSPGANNGVQYSDSTTKYSTPAQVNTALASYYTKAQIDTIKIAYLDQFNQYTNKQRIGNNTSYGSAWFTVVGDTLVKFRSPLFKDSSYFQVSTNVFTGSIKLELISKAGGVLIRIDSVTMTTINNIVSTSTSTNSFSGGVRGLWVEAATNQYLAVQSKFLLSSSADGTVRATNYAGNTDAIIQALTMVLTGLPTYADNAAATSGGLAVNRLYRTSTGQVMIVY